MYKCSVCGDDTLAPDEFSCYQCFACINCGGCDCEPHYEPEPTENEDGFMDNDYGQQSI